MTFTKVRDCENGMALLSVFEMLPSSLARDIAEMISDYNEGKLQASESDKDMKE